MVNDAGKVLADGDWIERYLKWTSSHEAPEVFHLWCAITLIAAVLNRKVWFEGYSKDGFKIHHHFPGQIMTVLVAGPGQVRKSACLDIFKGLGLKAVEAAKSSGSTGNLINFFWGDITPERLITTLAEQPEGIITIVADEFSNLFGTAEYSRRMVGYFLELAGAGSEFKYERQQRHGIIRNVCVTSLMATTPDSLSTSVPPAAQGQGLISRFIWVHADRPKVLEEGMCRKQDIDLDKVNYNDGIANSMVKDLIEFSKLHGVIDASDPARSWFKEWYCSEFSDSSGTPEGIKGWRSRRATWLIRVASVVAVARSGNPVIEETDFIRSNNYLTYIDNNMDKSFTLVGKHPQAADQGDHILRLFRTEDTVLTTTEILKEVLHYFRNAEEFRSMLISLYEAGKIKLVEALPGERDKMSAKWKLDGRL